MMILGSVLAACSWFAFGFALAKFLAHRRENRVLREFLQFMFGPDWNGRLESLDQVVQIKQMLNDRITYRGVSKTRKRPLLRDTACETLALGKGYCGEISRVAVRLLTLGGLKANRIYLTNGKWGHVFTEFIWDGGRKMFDGHNDPLSPIPDEIIGRVDSDDIARIPCTPNYPWKDFYRIKLFSRIPILSRFSKTRLPYPLAYHMESPSLITGYVSLIAAVIMRIAASYF